jgi:APA family basic amino acid/polyamine antiporter
MWNSLFFRPDKAALLSHAEGPALSRHLKLRDLVALGIAAIVGAGIFSTIGSAAASGGPAVIFLFILTALACLFSAWCYASFASALPIAGSAYTYAYYAFGELIAWIIGWDLVMEYAIGNIAVAISWSDYFCTMLNQTGISFPEWLSTDWRSAQNNAAILANAPRIGNFPIVMDLPAMLITLLVTMITYKGIQESKRTGNYLVLLKVAILLAFLAVGAFYVQPENWTPFFPESWKGVMGGVASVFFAYIGFDALSTTAEECESPEKDLPRGMMLALLICTVLYVGIALVLTGMVHYTKLNVGDPLAYAFIQNGLDALAGWLALSALVAMTGVLLVFAIGQPRIWLRMSRDGLLPKIFGKVHAKNRTPSFATILTGLIVGVTVNFVTIQEMTDLCSIGTLFAFILVCGGLLMKTDLNPPFKVPYTNAAPILWLGVAILAILQYLYPTTMQLWMWPQWPFVAITLLLALLSFKVKLSLIPVLGLLTNTYLILQLELENWMRFGIWMALGLLVYIFYGYSHSRFRIKN